MIYYGTLEPLRLESFNPFLALLIFGPISGRVPKPRRVYNRPALGCFSVLIFLDGGEGCVAERWAKTNIVMHNTQTAVLVLHRVCLSQFPWKLNVPL